MRKFATGGRKARCGVWEQRRWSRTCSHGCLESTYPTIVSPPTLTIIFRILDMAVLFFQWWVHTAVTESPRVYFIYRGLGLMAYQDSIPPMGTINIGSFLPWSSSSSQSSLVLAPAGLESNLSLALRRPVTKQPNHPPNGNLLSSHRATIDSCLLGQARARAKKRTRSVRFCVELEYKSVKKYPAPIRSLARRGQVATRLYQVLEYDRCLERWITNLTWNGRPPSLH